MKGLERRAQGTHMGKSDVDHFEASARRVSIHGEERGIWNHLFDPTDVEDHCVDEGHCEDVYQARETGCGCFCRNILCRIGLHVSPEAYNVYRMQDGSKLLDWGIDATDPTISMTTVEYGLGCLWRRTGLQLCGAVRLGSGSDWGVKASETVGSSRRASF